MKQSRNYRETRETLEGPKMSQNDRTDGKQMYSGFLIKRLHRTYGLVDFIGKHQSVLGI